VFLLLLTQTTVGWSKPDSWKTHGGGCIAREREALLSIKAGITADPERLLSSWRGQDCCQWEGIRCSNMTGHVIELDLHARYIRSSLKGIRTKVSGDGLVPPSAVRAALRTSDRWEQASPWPPGGSQLAWEQNRGVRA
uniref:Leucine-rich repeat-containing N-terminal plant-type domain-containing protein n=1 Tax=Triticum urartu TaxID=4572 RepID=A0A8R7TB27_TRIUA